MNLENTSRYKTADIRPDFEINIIHIKCLFKAMEQRYVHILSIVINIVSNMALHGTITYTSMENIHTQTPHISHAKIY